MKFYVTVFAILTMKAGVRIRARDDTGDSRRAYRVQHGMKTHILALSLAAIATVACSDDEPSSPNLPETIQLSAAQATAIKTRIGQLAPIHPELSWLADTIALVVGTGIEVSQVDITTNASDGPFYAISLQRTIRAGAANSASFDVILFNDPSNPTDFIIASGWINPNSNTTPPTTVTGQFDSPTANSTVNAHIFHVAGSTVSAWRATSGTATFSLGGTSGTCPSVPNTASVTCEAADLNATFNIVTAMSDNQTLSSTLSATLPAVDVSGIIIRMLIQ